MQKLLTVKELAVYLDVSTKTLGKLIREGKAPEHILVSQKMRFTEGAIQKFIDKSLDQIKN